MQRERTKSFKIPAVEKRLPNLPLTSGIENIPHTIRHTDTKSAESKPNGLLKRVGSIFSIRKRTKLDDQLTHRSPREPSCDANSRRSSGEYEAEIRCPSGLGSAASIISLPPATSEPPNDFLCYSGTTTSQHRSLKRTISSPNLLRTFSLRARGKKRGRNSPALAPKAQAQPETTVARQSESVTGPRLPSNIIFLIVAHLSRVDVTSCALVSRVFSFAARSALYANIDTSNISVGNLEKLIRVLSSRSQLAEVVLSFTCPKWPPFFVSAKDQNSYQRDTRLTAMFSLSLERMYNLTSLTLPSFDPSFLAHHTSFGLNSITFLVSTMSEAEAKALFAWLDGQVNVSTLRFPYLFGFEDSRGPDQAKIKANSNTRSRTPRRRYLSPFDDTHLPLSFTPPTSGPSPTMVALFSSPTLLPNLSVLHATPSLVISLGSNSQAERRPFRSVILNINSTLYNGLRPAALMSAIGGISHLGIRFSSGVDRRSFEKVIGAAGASLGSPLDENDDPFLATEKNGSDFTTKAGLRALEILFESPGGLGRDEIVYKSLQASLPRYCSLSSLKFSIQNASNYDSGSRFTSEQDMIELWAKTCPTLTSITLFSGTTWTP